MQFITISTIALAAVASALPNTVKTRAAGSVQISLPAGCTLLNLGKCVAHLASTGGTCATAAAMAGVDPAADLACIGSAAGTAASFDECKSCIPSSTEVIEG